MGEYTAISWCDHTFNPWIGCTKVSPACDGCYAEAMMDKRYGRVQWGAPGQGVGTRERTSPGNWSKPRAWARKAAKERTRPFVFCSSLADVFDNQVPVEWRMDLFMLIRQTPNLVWLLLTKRPQNIVKLFEQTGFHEWPGNAAIGTTVEDQERADINVPALLEAKKRLDPAFAFLSCEPLLGPLDLVQVRRTPPLGSMTALPCESGGTYLDWVITGGETDQGGHKARPTNPEWFRSLRDQCAFHHVPFHHKQNGEWVSVSEVEAEGEHYTFPTGQTVRRAGKAKAGRTIDGVEHNARPEVAR